MGTLGRSVRQSVSRYVSGVIDRGKWQRLQQWCADATALDSGHSYHALFIREEDWERYKPKSFPRGILRIGLLTVIARGTKVYGEVIRFS